ncbi:hypothetical protein [Psittacicella gerlachiana]|uniref:Uncharacterized protein n=1 Tax=Psittacicella gerlachiana TaxID=2028574 RepID=A0A3A1YH21_9GAMM|nr:hypothetical protein [Psittacicella gerlachiana]RIY37442.1 hypothetical protein CKF59_01740 [Psittacicella gerlachiana]
MQTNTYIDFFQLHNLGLQSPDYFASHKLVWVSPQVIDQVLAKPIETLKRTLAFETVLETSLFEQLLEQAQRFFYSLPYQERGDYAHTLGALQFFLYSSQQGVKHYLANAPKVTQARTVMERFVNGLLFVAANLLTLALDLRQRVQVSYQQQELKLTDLDLQLWLEQRQLRSESQALVYEVNLHWQPATSVAKGEIKQKFALLKDFLFSPTLQKTLSCIYPHWEKALLAICSQQGTDLLQASLNYGRQGALTLSQNQIRPQELYKLQQKMQQKFALNNYALGQEILTYSSRLHGKQPLIAYLQQKLALWQLQLPVNNLSHKEIIKLLHLQFLTDYVELYLQELGDYGLGKTLQGLRQELESFEAKEKEQATLPINHHSYHNNSHYHKHAYVQSYVAASCPYD